MTITETEIDPLLDFDPGIPCRGALHMRGIECGAEAEWILYLAECCVRRVCMALMFCSPCKDKWLDGKVGKCFWCGFEWRPRRHAVTRIEPL